MRILSLVLIITAFGTACTKSIKSDTGSHSSPATNITGSDESSGPMKEIDGRRKAGSSVEPSPTAVESSEGLAEFKSPEKDVFDTDRIHFNIDSREWKPIADQDGIQTFEKKETQENVVAFRGETVIPANLPKIATILNSSSLRKEWIDSLVEAHTVDQTSTLDRIEYNHTAVPWPFQDRDFVYHVQVKVNRRPPTMLITMKSQPDPREPEHDGIVRGEIIYSYYYLKQVAGVRATKVVVEMALDPKGAIPKWLVTLSQKKWPFNTLLSLKKVSQREDLVVSKEIEDYFKERPTKTTTKVAKKKSRKKKVRRKPGGKR